MSTPKKPRQVAMQVRCVNCKREQYALAVYKISHGKHPCVWCGHTPKPMTENEYRAAIADSGS